MAQYRNGLALRPCPALDQLLIRRNNVSSHRRNPITSPISPEDDWVWSERAAQIQQRHSIFWQTWEVRPGAWRLFPQVNLALDHSGSLIWHMSDCRSGTVTVSTPLDRTCFGTLCSNTSTWKRKIPPLDFADPIRPSFL